MAEVIWTERAISQLDEIAGYIALDKPAAARQVVARITAKTRALAVFPRAGKRVPEIPHSAYRMFWVAPCWVYYRVASDDRVIVLHVRRAERPLRLDEIAIA